jgi:hypothetical protein
MYELNLDERSFFCCEPGQFGVLPISGYAGICEPNNQVVASSLIATAASQIGGGAVATGNTGGAPAATTNTVTSTLKGGGVTTITSIATSTQAGGGASSTGGSTSSNPLSTEAKKLGLSTGAIVGIAVGALLVLVVTLVSYWLCRRKRNTRYGTEGPSRGAPMYSAVPQPYQSQNLPEYKSPVATYAAPQQGYGGTPPPTQAYAVSPSSPQPHGYGPSQPPPPQGPTQGGYGGRPSAVEVPAPQRWEGRAEMGL